MSASTATLPMLIIDTASKNTWIGFINSDQTTTWESSEDEASYALFNCLRDLQAQGIDWKNARSIAFNQGPGSMLGIRTAIMAIRTWTNAKTLPEKTQLFTYNSLALASELPEASTANLIISDARRKSWNAFFPQEETPRTKLLSNEELESQEGNILILEEFTQWTKTSAELHPLSYNPSIAFEKPSAIKHLQPIEIPIPLILRESEYQKWVPRFSTTGGADQ